MTSTSRAMARSSANDWASLPEDTRGELVDGFLVEEEKPDYVHELIVAWLIERLRAWARPRGGFVAGSEVKFILDAGLGRKPDVSLILAGKPPPRRGPLTAPPFLMVEVLSASPCDVRRDRTEKPAEYAAFGVQHLWLVDPEAKSIEGMVLEGQGYRQSFRGERGVIVVPGFDGLVLELDGLWGEVDQLG